MVTHDPSPYHHETLPRPSFEEGLQYAMDFMGSATTKELEGRVPARHFIEITWEQNTDDTYSLLDVRTRVQGNEGDPVHIHSLATGDTVLEVNGTEQSAGYSPRPNTKRFYFEGVLPTHNHILSSFAPHISTYQDAEALLLAAKPHPSMYTDDSFFTFVASRTVRSLTHEPEHMQASRELIEGLGVQRGGLRLDRFARQLGNSLVRDLAPPSEEPSMYDQELIPEQMTAAIHTYEAVYGFEPGTFSSPYVYQSFAFSQVLHQRLAREGGGTILKATRQHPTQFAGMYMAAVLKTLAKDPTRNSDKVEGVRSRIIVRNNAGEENISFDKFVGVARAVAKSQRQRANEAGEDTPFNLLTPTSMQNLGDAFGLLLSLTHDRENSETRNVQQEQDTVYQEIVNMILAPTQRKTGTVALGPRPSA
ncbi:hypothetical protein EYC59_01070 [Candidatus Saccharibacteria bacterium]|nr:MAG: hypothetical protein EYC59_01070 [Candidatus Saccharibacteria bacterium]